ncbi:MAG TPA: Hsp20/alpha crystallin family protein [Candidatus Limnocylindrales bacterium]|jgi:HSP20 family protein
MTLMRRPSPFAEMVTLRDAVERMFDERFFRPIWPLNGERPVLPPLDLYTTPEAVIAKVALPGVTPEEVEVTIADEMVTITGKYMEEKKEIELGYVYKELHRGTFTRTFALPTPIKAEAAKATFKDGLLILTLPKTEEVKPKHLKVVPV